MNPNKGGRRNDGKNGRNNNRERGDARQLRTAPYEVEDRRSGRSLCRAYEQFDFRRLRQSPQHTEADEDAAAELALEQQERETLERLRASCMQLSIDFSPGADAEQLEELLREPLRKREQLLRVGVSANRLLSAADIEIGWLGYQRALRMAGAYGVAYTEGTPLSVVTAETTRRMNDAQQARCDADQDLMLLPGQRVYR